MSATTRRSRRVVQACGRSMSWSRTLKAVVVGPWIAVDHLGEPRLCDLFNNRRIYPSLRDCRHTARISDSEQGNVMSAAGATANAKMATQTFPCWRAPGRTTSIPHRRVRCGSPRNPRANSAGSIRSRRWGRTRPQRDQIRLAGPRAGVPQDMSRPGGSSPRS